MSPRQKKRRPIRNDARIGDQACIVGHPRYRAVAMHGRKRGWWRRLTRWIVVAGIVWVVATTTLVLLFRFVDPPGSSFMLQRTIEAAIRDEPDFRLSHQWRRLAEISPHLRIAVIASEDQKFPRHYGFDFETLREVAAEHLAGDGRRGGSTISQQTAKNLFLWPGRSWVRKGFEAWFTVLIEALWPKRRILEVYLNIAQFGDDVYGAEGAARTYFGKPASALTLDEATRLAAVLPAPNRYRVAPPSTQIIERARWIQGQIDALGGPAYLAGIAD